MDFDYLIPIDDALMAFAKLQNDQSFGHCIEIYTSQNEFPNLTDKKIAIVGVEEDRASTGNDGTGSDR